MTEPPEPFDEMAEDRGFEPLRVLTQHDFQSCALGHYANPPSVRVPEAAPPDRIGSSDTLSLVYSCPWPLAWWYLTELPQGGDAARVGELFRVRGGPLCLPGQPTGA